MAAPECAICLEEIEKKDEKILSCNHVFHKECIDLWTQKNPICPYCRKFLKSYFEAQHNYVLFTRNCNIFIDDNNSSKITLVYNYPFSIKVKSIVDISINKIKCAQINNNYIYIIYYKNNILKTLRFKFKKN